MRGRPVQYLEEIPEFVDLGLDRRGRSQDHMPRLRSDIEHELDQVPIYWLPAERTRLASLMGLVEYHHSVVLAEQVLDLLGVLNDQSRRNDANLVRTARNVLWAARPDQMSVRVPATSSSMRATARLAR